MKKKLTAALLISASWAAHAQTLPADGPLLTANNYLDLAQAGNRMVAVGERGAILYSDDQGKSWRQAQSPVSAQLTAVCFTDAYYGWAVGHDAVVLRTLDGGESWEKQYQDVFDPDAVDDWQDEELDDLDMDDLYSMDDLYADPYGDDDLPAAGGQEVADSPLLDVFCESRDHVFAVGGFGYYLETRDGGASWTRQTDKLNNRDSGHLYAIAGLSNSPVRYIAGERGMLFRSDDRGGEWQRLQSPSAGTFFGITVLSANQLFVYGLQGQIWQSLDGGASWQRIPSGLTRGINAMAPLADGRLLFAANAGGLLSSSAEQIELQLRYLPDRQSIAALLPTADGGAVLAGQGGVRLLNSID